MGRVMNKEEIINETLNVLGSISVPVALKETVTDPIAGAMKNLIIVLQMINKEKEVEDDGAEADSE